MNSGVVYHQPRRHTDHQQQLHAEPAAAGQQCSVLSEVNAPVWSRLYERLKNSLTSGTRTTDSAVQDVERLE